MKKYKGFYLAICNKRTEEGGGSRNKAFYEYFNKKGYSIINVLKIHSFLRLFVLIHFLIKLYIFRGEKIFIHLSSLVYLLPVKFLKYKFYQKTITFLIELIDKKNITIEINDLPLEQSKDLELDIDPNWYKFQKLIFETEKVNFIFASSLMREYVNDNYAVASNFFNRSRSILNGCHIYSGSGIQNNIKNNKIRYVYAGTLNKGRQIEDMINIFIKNKNIDLILMGTDGEWIKKYKSDNIKYYGKLSEKEAFSIAKTCDIGLIPYDSSRNYYNICFPTKVSFYIVAGLPILMTDLREVTSYKKLRNAIVTENISLWSDIIEKQIDKSFISEYKNNVTQIRKFYTWDFLLKNVDV